MNHVNTHTHTRKHPPSGDALAALNNAAGVSLEGVWAESVLLYCEISG